MTSAIPGGVGIGALLVGIAVWWCVAVAVAMAVRWGWRQVHGPELPSSSLVALLVTAALVPNVLGGFSVGGLEGTIGTVLVTLLQVAVLGFFLRGLAPDELAEPMPPAEVTEDHEGMSFLVAGRSPHVAAVLLGVAAGTCGLGAVLVLAWSLVPSRYRRVRIRNGMLAVDGGPAVALQGARIVLRERWDGQPAIVVDPREGGEVELPLGAATTGEVRWIGATLADAARRAPPEARIPEPPAALRAVRERLRE